MKTPIVLLLAILPYMAVGAYKAKSSMTTLKSVDDFPVNGELENDEKSKGFDLKCKWAIHAVKAERSEIRAFVKRWVDYEKTVGPLTSTGIKTVLAELGKFKKEYKHEHFCAKVARTVFGFLELQDLIPDFKAKVPPGFVFESNLRHLSKHLLRALSLTTGCRATARPRKCTADDKKYRSADGICNNLWKVLHGAGHTLINRLNIFGSPLARYQNGLNSPRSIEASPRKISTILVNGVEDPSTEVTDILKSFGQFIDHDVGLTPHVTASECKNCQPSDVCFPIPVPQNDTRITNRACLDFARSFPACGTGTSSIFLPTVTQREQLNEITSFLDSSNVYGSTSSLLRRLREHKGGRLRTFMSDSGQLYLPFASIFPDTCDTSKEACLPDFLAGDERVSENTQLATMHTIWVRFHNWIASQLSKYNKEWNDERLFQEARAILNGVYQKIVMKDYLEQIIGKENRDNLFKKCEKYNPKVDPSIFQAFTTASFRLGHTQIREFIARLKSDGQPIPLGNIRMRDQFFQPREIFKAGGLVPYIYGLLAPGKKVDPANKVITVEVREHLFEQIENPAADLIALNIQRARDHGIPSYNEILYFCKYGKKPTKHFAPRGLVDSIMKFKNIPVIQRTRLKKVYGGDFPNKVDLFVGGVLENQVSGGQVGETVTCVLKTQFARLCQGDRFFFSRHFKNEDQRNQIKKMTLAKLICTVVPEITEVPRNAFRQGDKVKCKDIGRMNLKYWKEESEDMDF